MLKALAVIAVLATGSAAFAAAPNTGVLVSSSWLATHAADKNLVILYVGDKAAYDAGHMPGARFVTLNDLAVTGPAPANLVVEMPSPEVLRATLQKLGVSDTSRIIVAYGKDRLPNATRIMFTLDAAGLGDRASLLDGGMVAWERGGGAMTAEVSPVTVGTLSPLKMKALIVDADFVRSHAASPKFKVVDARADAFYTGAQAGGSQAAPQPKGHVKGAKSIPFSSVSSSDATIKSAEELAAMFKAQGIQPGDEVVAYCHVGVQATVVMLAAKIIGVDAKLYDGSYQDWSQRGLPVDGPAGTPAP